MQQSTLQATLPMTTRDSAFARWTRFLLGVAFYAVGVTGLVWLILASFGVVPFMAGLVEIESTTGGILFNLGLVAVFGIQHAIMARPKFKEAWIKIVPASLERSIFTLGAGLTMSLMMFGFQPLPTMIWSVSNPIAEVALYAICGLGWAYLFTATFAINHFELFGLQQVWSQLRGKECASPPFVQRLMYRFDRHPIMTGALVGMWVTPHMTLGHLVLAAGMTAYVILGVTMEEKDLVAKHGEDYEGYRNSTRSIVPTLASRS